MKKTIKLLFLITFILIFISIYYLSSINDKIENSDIFLVLNIPKINLKKEVYKYDSINNDVNKGLYLATDNSFLNGSIVIASHSGNSVISYFDNLDKLGLDDEVFIYKYGYVYTYIVTDRYLINKNGKFKYINNDDVLYLITCDKNSHTKQLVIEGKLKKIQKNQQFLKKS